jgi:hypothetical protein
MRWRMAACRQGVPGGTHFRCERPSTIREGPDKLSRRVGRLEPGEVVVSLEIVKYEGCVRVRCSRGWIGVTTRAGSVKLVQVRADCSAASHVAWPRQLTLVGLDMRIVRSKRSSISAK